MNNPINKIPNLNKTENFKKVYNVLSVLLVGAVFLLTNIGQVISAIDMHNETKIHSIEDFKKISTEKVETTTGENLELVKTKISSSYNLLSKEELNNHFTGYTTKIIPIRVKLDRFVSTILPQYKESKQITLNNNGGMFVYENDKRIGEFKEFSFDKENLLTKKYTFVAKTIFYPTRITSLRNTPKWATTEEQLKEFNDNIFRGILELRLQNTNNLDSFEVINELDLEQYIKGIAEATGNTHQEKMKVMAVISRSYAHFYLKTDFEKFVGKDYHLDDNPQHSQKYLGYGFEQRNENWLKAVKETQGYVLFDDKNNPVIAPYSTCTLRNADGELRRKTLQEAGWGNQVINGVEKFNSDVIKPVRDIMGGECLPTQVAGHGVGLSGNGAEAMATEGKDFISILQYYYHNTTLINIIK